MERQSVTEFAVAALVSAVLPGLAGIVEDGGNARARDPLQEGLTDELRPVVRAHERWRSAQVHQQRWHVDHALRGSGHVDGQALADVFVHDGQHLICWPLAVVSKTKS